MNNRTIILREAALSAIINGALSVFFFLLVFGYRMPSDMQAFGYDFFPQAFMVSLMGSLIPALILRRSIGGAALPIIRRTVMFAVAGAVIAGGGALAVCMAFGTARVPPLDGLMIKAAFGAVLGAIVTPLALLPLLRSERTP